MPTFMHMRWEDLCFIHWRFEPSVVAARLPPGLRLDTFDGSAWMGVVPFRMNGVSPLGFGIPFGGDFLELNLRTYVRDRHGRPGVWFWTLDCNDPPAVWGARMGFGLRYHHAHMRASPQGGSGAVRYLARRNGRVSSFRYQPDGEFVPASGDPLTNFLLERYRLFSWKSGRGQLWTGQVVHDPYLCCPAKVTAHCDGLFLNEGFEAPRRPPDSALLAKDVKVTAGFPSPVPSRMDSSQEGVKAHH